MLIIYFQALLLLNPGVLSHINLSISMRILKLQALLFYVRILYLSIYSNVAERTPLEEFGLHDVTFSPAVSNVTLLFPIGDQYNINFKNNSYRSKLKFRPDRRRPPVDTHNHSSFRSVQWRAHGRVDVFVSTCTHSDTELLIYIGPIYIYIYRSELNIIF